jgi:hypothetical protein
VARYMKDISKKNEQSRLPALLLFVILPFLLLLLGSPVDKGRIGSYTKLCDFTLLFMILQVELRLNKDH